MRDVFEDTANVNAHYYLDSYGHEISRMEFLGYVHEGQWSYMIYVGGGYVPLKVAVTTVSHRRHHAGGEADAIEAFEEWARETRPEEIGEGEDYEKEVQEAIEAGEEPPSPEYEAHIEAIPERAGTEPASIEKDFYIDIDGQVTMDGVLVGNALADDIGPGLTYTDFELLRHWRDLRERMDQWVEEDRRIPKGVLYAHRLPGKTEGRLGFGLRFGATGRGKRWGEGLLEHLGRNLETLVQKLMRVEKVESQIGREDDEYVLRIEDPDFDGFSFVSLAAYLRRHQLLEYVVEPV